MSSPPSRRTINRNQGQPQQENSNRTAAARGGRGADLTSRGTQTEAEAEAEVNEAAIAAPALAEFVEQGFEQTLARPEESNAARAAFAVPAPAPAPTRFQQRFAQMKSEALQQLDDHRAQLDQHNAQYEDSRRRHLTEHLEDQIAKAQSIAQLFQELQQQQAATSGDESAVLPPFNYEELLAQIKTDLSELQQQGGDCDKILGRFHERGAVLADALDKVRAMQEEQEQKKQREKEEKRQQQIDDLTTSVSALQVEMTVLRDQNTTLTHQNAVLSTDLIAVRAQVIRLEEQLAGGSGSGQEEKKEEEGDGQQDEE